MFIFAWVFTDDGLNYTLTNRGANTRIPRSRMRIWAWPQAAILMRLQRIFFFPLKYNNFSTFSQLHNLQPPIRLPYLPSAAFQSPSTVLPASLFIISSLSIDIIPLNSTVSYTFPPYFPEPPTRFYSLQKVSSSRYDRAVKEDAICQCMIGV